MNNEHTEKKKFIPLHHEYIMYNKQLHNSILSISSSHYITSIYNCQIAITNNPHNKKERIFTLDLSDKASSFTITYF